MIDKSDKLPVTRQCDLLDLSRSSVYYTPVPLNEEDRELMRQIDEIHMASPFYGSRKIRDVCIIVFSFFHCFVCKFSTFSVGPCAILIQDRR